MQRNDTYISTFEIRPYETNCMQHILRLKLSNSRFRVYIRKLPKNTCFIIWSIKSYKTVNNHYRKIQSMIANRHWWSTTLIIPINDSYTQIYYSVPKWLGSFTLCARHNVADCSIILLITWKLMDNHIEPIFCYMKEV